MKNKSKISLLIFLFCFILINLYLTFSIINGNEIKGNVVRLHVIANSNDINDQIIKLKVSEILENYIKSLNLENKSSNEILNKLNENKEAILNLVNTELLKNNINYTSSISIGKIYYSDKKENAIYEMDKGYYNSLKINLGEAKGKNFWDFIAPNKENLNKLKSYETILSGISNKKIEYKSKIIEKLTTKN